MVDRHCEYSPVSGIRVVVNRSVVADFEPLFNRARCSRTTFWVNPLVASPARMALARSTTTAVIWRLGI